MPKQSVEQFLSTLQHSRKDDIERVRALILAADPKLKEAIKWNAPSYGYDDDRITFRLKPGDRVELIFHRGAKPKATDGFSFADDSGLLTFLAPDRAMASFANRRDIDANADALQALVRNWMKATA